MRVLGRLLAVLVLSAVGIAGAGAAILVAPHPLFPHRLHEGRLSILSDRPLDEPACRAALRDVDGRLRADGFDPATGRHRIVVAHARWRQRLTFLWAYGAGGVNFYPLTRNVFLRDADPGCRHIVSPLGTPVPPPRTFAYFAAHEIAHSLTGEAVGALAFHRLPVWIREGVADHVALPGRGDFGALARAYQAGERELDPRRSGLYARYRLLVLFFIEREGWSLARILASNLPQDEAERRLDSYLAAHPP